MIILVTGATGQDGSYLIEKLTKNNIVYGLHRRTSQKGMGALDHKTCHYKEENFHSIFGDLTDQCSIDDVFKKIKQNEGAYPDKVFHMGAFTHVGLSYKQPKVCFETNLYGTMHILEAVRRFNPGAIIYHAATSELFDGDPTGCPQNIDTPMNPRTPYAISKMAAYNLCNYYRDNYKMQVVQGILFNHASPRRPKDFVTMKIVNGLCQIALGMKKEIHLGNLDAQRDWGYAGDYMDAIIKIADPEQNTKMQNYVVGTGKSRSIRQLLATTQDILNSYVGLNVIDVQAQTVINPDFKRTNEVWKLEADPARIMSDLNWKPKTSFRQMLSLMIESELNLLRRENKNGVL